MVDIKWLDLVTAFFLSFVLILRGQNLSLAQSEYPSPQNKYVNDYANVLESATIEDLKNRLGNLERETGIEGTVLTISSIEDYETGDRTSEDFATHLFNTWGIGNKEKNDGFLILLVVTDRKVRIELGKGYDNDLTLAVQRIISQDMIPTFREKNYNQGIYAGTLSTIKVVAETHQFVTEPASQPSVGIWTIVWVAIGVIGVFGGVIGLMIYDSSRYLSVVRKSWRRKYSSRKSREDHSWTGGGRGGRGGGGSFGGGGSIGGGASGGW